MVNNNKYEERLKYEFIFLRKLQTHPFIQGIIEISYQDRIDGDFRSILGNPSKWLYPNKFKITYKFPIMYVGKGMVMANWSYSFNLYVPEIILMDTNSKLGDNFTIENNSFPDGMVPYNPNVSKTWIDLGCLWQVANKHYGIWYFIVELGSMLNMEMPEINSEAITHLNYDAWDYWCNEREKAPNNDLKWPYGFDDEESIYHKLSEITLKLTNGEEYDISDIDLNYMTPALFISLCIENGIIVPENQLPKHSNGAHARYRIIDKSNVTIPFDCDNTFAELGFSGGDIVRIIVSSAKPK